MSTVPQAGQARTELSAADLATFSPFAGHAAGIQDYAETARREQPVFWSEPVKAWCVARYDLVRAVLGDPAGFSSREVYTPPAGLPANAQTVMDFFYGDQVVSMVDPPLHTPIRRALQESFRPRAIASYEPAVRARIEACVAAIGPPERFDLVETFSAQFPLAVILDLIGILPDDFEKVRRWVGSLLAVAFAYQELAGEQLEAMGADLLDALAYFRELVARRIAEPGDDLVSLILAAAGGALTPDQVVINVFNLVGAAYETTGCGLTNLVLTLLSEPAQWARLARGELDAAAVVAEGLRLDSPVLGMFRVATRDVTLGEARIAAGDLVFCWFASANHDSALIPDAGTFRLDRPVTHSVTFGHGIHTCMAAPLARLELNAALTALAARFPRLHLVPDQPLTYEPLLQRATSPSQLWLSAT
jgi:cytochrome P450